jgi:hypothetical protein
VQLREAPEYPWGIVSGLISRYKKNCMVSFSSPFSIGVSAHAMIVMVVLWRVTSERLLGLFMN